MNKKLLFVAFALLPFMTLSADESNSQPSLFESLELLIKKASQKPPEEKLNEADFEAELQSPAVFSVESEESDDEKLDENSEE